MKRLLLIRILGFVGSLLFTLLSYFLIINPNRLRVGLTGIISIIFVFALLQFGVQFFCFINMWKEKKPYWNMHVFIAMTAVIVVVIVGSLWIMHHLNENMMPKM